MAEAVYLLCALTSIGCAALLTRSYVSTKTRLLLWASLCFAFLAINNALLFIDLVMVPTIDLSTVRAGASLIAICLLLYALVWESG